jgi:Ca-activated chloride channel family protein
VTAQLDLYTILGVPPEASDEDIRNAYRALARRLHPDVNPNLGAANQFRDINAANSVLSDLAERAKYSARYQPGPSYYTIRVTTSQPTISVLGEPQVLYLLVEILPEQAGRGATAQTHLNLTLVLDQSNSMRGSRLERVRVAANSIIDQLDDKDIFSIITFSDAAEVLLKAQSLSDKTAAKGRVAVMQAFGGTEIYQGLSRGVQENQRFAGRKYVNHIILLTDGRTFGDEQQALNLAEKAFKEGIGISAMGIGDDWNDTFLDQLASRTGGTSEYINSAGAVVRFLNERVRNLGQAYAERLSLSVAPDPDVKLEAAFRLLPSAQPLPVDRDPIPLGALQMNSSVSVLLQFQLGPQAAPGLRSLVRLDATGDIMREQKTGYKVVADLGIEVVNEAKPEEPPYAILDALSKLTLYRIQEKAEKALAKGNIQEATKHLENLSTRLFQAGEPELAKQAMAEAQRVSQTSALSPEGQKNLKYGTRMLLLGSGDPIGTKKMGVIGSSDAKNTGNNKNGTSSINNK